MRLAKVTVTNFRSILAAESFELADYTVLVGPNNEGKSNLMRAMVMALDAVHAWAALPETPSASGVDHGTLRLAARRRSFALSQHDRRSRVESSFDWMRDFPIAIQSRERGPVNSRVRLDLELDASEVEEFRHATGSQNNGQLPVELLFGPKVVKLAVLKQGPGSANMASKSVAIADMIARNLQMFSVPTSRSESSVLAVIQSLVSRQLRQITRGASYLKAAETIEKLRQQAVSELEASMVESLGEYLTDMREVHLIVASVAEQSLRVDDFLIDDGVSTSISEKGDGVKSLAAISLMQQAARDTSSSVALIAAIDEPEAHLHPDAIHTLKRKLKEIAMTQQVIISTHAPVLVNRARVAANIIVSANQARPAKSLSQIRQVLGVRPADNLSHAELVVLVEGVSDETALRAILSSMSKRLQKSVDDGAIAFIAMRGVKRLHTELLSQSNNVCRSFVIVDNDQAGRAAVANEVDAGLLADKSYFVLTRPGGDSELEDHFDLDLVSAVVKNRYGVTIPLAELKKRNAKFSDRIRGALESRGRIVSDDSLEQLKIDLAAAVGAGPTEALAPDSVDLFLELTAQLEAALQSSP